MSPAHVFEPTYQGLKARLKAGTWPMGMRLEATKLADELGVSITPVRDSLNRLVGERMVELWPGEGYRVARFNERLLRDLFVFNRDLLSRAVVAMVPSDMTNDQSGMPPPYPERVARLFSDIAAASGSVIVVETILAINDRLHPARCLDRELIPQCDLEIELFIGMIRDNADPAARGDWVESYHDRRCELAAEYVFRLELGPNLS